MNTKLKERVLAIEGVDFTPASNVTLIENKSYKVGDRYFVYVKVKLTLTADLAAYSTVDLGTLPGLSLSARRTTVINGKEQMTTRPYGSTGDRAFQREMVYMNGMVDLMPTAQMSAGDYEVVYDDTFVNA
jgi:hypothetical protein